ncbi:MAG: hypothetical protein ACM3WV_11395 [Bacillota bacterium]
MKKILVLALALSMLFGLAAVSPAAINVKMGGYFLGTLILGEDGPGNSIRSFTVNRLALITDADFGQNNGFKSEIRFMSHQNNLLWQAYYYQKNIFAQDELDLGYFPLTWHAGRSMTLGGSLGDQMCEMFGFNAAGAKYRVNLGLLTAIGSVTNAANMEFENGDEYLDFTLRGEFALNQNFIVGLGIAQDTRNGGAEDSNFHMVVDAAFRMDAFSAYFEYISYTPTDAGVKQDAVTGMYIEGAYAVSRQMNLYAGMCMAEELDLYWGGLPAGLDYMTVGGNYMLNEDIIVWGEYFMDNLGDYSNLKFAMKVMF